MCNIRACPRNIYIICKSSKTIIIIIIIIISVNYPQADESAREKLDSIELYWNITTQSPSILNYFLRTSE
jgi:hypothetical protein